MMITLINRKVKELIQSHTDGSDNSRSAIEICPTSKLGLLSTSTLPLTLHRSVIPQVPLAPSFPHATLACTHTYKSILKWKAKVEKVGEGRLGGHED